MEKQDNKAIKVGIVTLVGLFNYGNRLQAYATYSIYRSLGFYPCLIEPEAHFCFADRTKSWLKKLFRVQQIDPSSSMSMERKNRFLSFNQSMRIEHLGYSPKKVPDAFAFFSVGSDQVWNPSYVRGFENWFYLKGIDSQKKIALSPSIGIDSLTRREAAGLAKGAASFPKLSVREDLGKKLLFQAGGLDSAVICDPTLVLYPSEWRSVSNSGLVPSGQYVFTYLLGGMTPESTDVLEKVTCQGKIPVVALSDRQKPGEPDAGPAEFISLIDHASHVVTDSFHAAVFSSILQAPLTIVHREGTLSMFSRLEQLSQMLGIEDKVYGSSSYDLSLAGDYDGVSEAIGRERKKFMNYLEGCLDEQLPGWRDGARG